jgi:hypothetical protein
MGDPETFKTLFFDLPHWEFELFVTLCENVVTGGLIGMVVWPFIKRHWGHHVARDIQDGHTSSPDESDDFPKPPDGGWSNEALVDLVRHTNIYSGYRDNGYDKMDKKMRHLYNHINGRTERCEECGQIIPRAEDEKVPVQEVTNGTRVL